MAWRYHPLLVIGYCYQIFLIIWKWRGYPTPESSIFEMICRSLHQRRVGMICLTLFYIFCCPLVVWGLPTWSNQRRMNRLNDFLYGHWLMEYLQDYNQRGDFILRKSRWIFVQCDTASAWWRWLWSRWTERCRSSMVTEREGGQDGLKPLVQGS